MGRSFAPKQMGGPSTHAMVAHHRRADQIWPRPDGLFADSIPSGAPLALAALVAVVPGHRLVHALPLALVYLAAAGWTDRYVRGIGPSDDQSTLVLRLAHRADPFPTSLRIMIAQLNTSLKREQPVSCGVA